MLAVLLGMGSSAAWGDTYTEGFEGKTAGSNYQGTVTVSTSESDCGIGWEMYYGTVSTSSKISGSNSAALRLYSSSNNLGYLKTTTPIEGLSNVSFKAKAATSSSAKIKVNVDYSIDGSSWTTIASNQLFSSSAATYNFNIPSGGKYFRLIITSSSTKPTSGNAQLTIDDVVFTYTPAAALSSIALSGTYPKTFHQGDAFSHEGMIVTATYADDSQANVTASATFSGYDMNSTGVQTVTVSYTENEVTKTATYDITVNAPATLTSIALSGTYPTVFDYGAAFSSEGIVVTANYDDETNKIVTGDATFSGYNMTSAGAQTVTVSYTENEVTKTTTYEITVNAYVQPTSVTVNMNYAWLGSSNGSNISADKLPVVKAQDNVQITITDGTSTHPRGDADYIRVYVGSTMTFEAPSGYDITGIVFTTGGSGTWKAPNVNSGTLSSQTWSGTASSVTFTMTGSCFISTAAITLTKQKSLSSIAVSGTYPTEFEVGDEFSHEGAVVTATYDDASETVVTASATFSTPVMSSAGVKTVTVSYSENDVEKTTTYDITVKPAVPTFSPAAGAVVAGTEVTLSTTTAGATIYYTTDGSEPTASSSEYSEAFTITAATTIKAIAVKDATSSDVATATYTIAVPVATPTFTPAEGTYTSNQSVTISTATDGATIYYTTNGDTPTSSSTVYSSAITVSETQTIKAIAVKDATSSDVASAAYTINKPTPSLSFANDSYDGFLGSDFTAPTLANTNSVSPITYSSSNTDAATVNESTGAITLVGEGSTTITASFAGNASYTAANAAYTLNVSNPAVATTVTISAIGITNTDVYVSTTAGSFAATVKDNENATIGDASVTWSSSNPDVATINSSTGVVTLVAAGSTTITAAYDGVQYSYLSSSKTYELIVTSSKPVTEETFTFSTMGYDNGANVTSVDGEACTLTFAQGTNGANAPKYYNTGTGTRMYSGNTLTIASATKTIESIVFTFDGDNATLALAGGQPGTLTDAFESKRTWTGSASSIQFTTTATNRIQVIKVTYDNRVTSDLTKTGDVTLDFKGGDTNADLTDYFTTSSTGAITYTVADGTIIENIDELISALKLGSTTVTVSQAQDATYKAGEITINVTVNDTRTACVTVLDLTSAKTINFGEAGDLTATSTKDGDFTGTITYTYESADPTIFYIDGSEYLGAGVGGTTVTVWATPTGGNAANYSAVSKVVNVQVNGTNSITLDKSSYSAAYGSQAAFDISVTTPVSYDGTITAESNNSNVATVSVDGTTVTVTPKAVVGTATISITAGTGTYYSGTDTKTCTLEITAPTGSATAPTPVDVFSETFNGCDGTGGNTGGWSGSIASKAYSNTMADNTWSMTTAYAADKCVRMGTGSSLGIATTPAIALEGGITYTLTFRAGAWSGKSTNLKVSMTNGTLSADHVTMKDGAFDDFELTITEASAGATITFEGNTASNSQFLLDDVKVTMPAETSTSVKTTGGYATYCYQYPLNLDGISGAKAYIVSSVDQAEEKLMLTQITGSIKGGVPFILKSDADTDDIEIPLADESTTVPAGNLLVGTLAPTFVEQTSGDYTNFAYSKSYECFVKLGAAGNTVPANRAYLPINLGSGSSVKTFAFDFEDLPTGLNDVRSKMEDVSGEIFNLAGQKMNRLQKGINIVNGRKVLVK